LFVSNSQVIGCEDCLRNNLYCVGWGVKLYSIQFKHISKTGKDADMTLASKSLHKEASNAESVITIHHDLKVT